MKNYSMPECSWTVGIPTYNRAAFLKQAVLSALDQIAPPCQIIVSDNCSSDETGALVNLLAASDSKILYLRHKISISPFDNFLSSLEIAKTKYFSWLQDDDLIFNNFSSECLAVLEANPRAVACIGYAIRSKYSNRISWKDAWVWGTILHLDIVGGRISEIPRFHLLPWIALRSPGFSPVAIFRTESLMEAIHKLKSQQWSDLIYKSYFAEHAIIAMLNSIGPMLYHPRPLGILRDHEGAMSNHININSLSFQSHYSLLLDLLNHLSLGHEDEIESSFASSILHYSAQENEFFVNRLSSVNNSYACRIIKLIPHSLGLVSPKGNLLTRQLFLKYLKRIKAFL